MQLNVVADPKNVCKLFYLFIYVRATGDTVGAQERALRTINEDEGSGCGLIGNRGRWTL